MTPLVSLLIAAGILAALVILIRRAPDWKELPCDRDCGCVDCTNDRAGA